MPPNRAWLGFKKAHALYRQSGGVFGSIGDQVLGGLRDWARTQPHMRVFDGPSLGLPNYNYYSRPSMALVPYRGRRNRVGYFDPRRLPAKYRKAPAAGRRVPGLRSRKQRSTMNVALLSRVPASFLARSRAPPRFSVV